MFRNKNKLWVLLIIFVASCSDEIDFTKDLELNSSESSWKFRRKQPINSKVFKIDKGHSESITYVNLKLDDVTNFKSVIVLNNGYEFGNLREIEYRLGGCTSYFKQNRLL